MDPDEPRIVEPEPEVLTGDDDVLRQPPTPIDPYTPVPHPPRGERRLWAQMRLWILAILIVAVIVTVWLAVR